MQRRSGLGKGLARISPPNQHRLTGMGSDSANNRWNQRALGVTNRIWAIIFAFILILGLSRFISPSTQESPHLGSFTTDGLVPKNYLHDANYLIGNASDTPNPFDFCPVFGPNDGIAEKYGVVALAQSRLHLGSGGRVHRVIHKALLGQPVTMSVLGGSSA